MYISGFNQHAMGKSLYIKFLLTRKTTKKSQALITTTQQSRRIEFVESWVNGVGGSVLVARIIRQ